jgi:D-alanyl-D-alanine carboxypeptidase/D-alanyl-D-alanine-endopeptidase (penicillin-binding protein 4)
MNSNSRRSPLFFAYWVPLFFLLLAACTTQKKIRASIDTPEFLHEPPLNTAHVGLAVYDPENQKWLYEYQDDKYFLPASNTKLFSLYAGMKYLGDSLPGMGWQETDTALYLFPTGDPSFLHPDFPNQPVFQFLKKSGKKIFIVDTSWREQAWGAGWSWDDYNDDYMVERSVFPIYGNLIHWVQESQRPDTVSLWGANNVFVYSLPEVDWKLRFNPDNSATHFFVRRKLAENEFEVTQGPEKKAEQAIPFITNGIQSAILLLRDSLGSRHELEQAPPAELNKLAKLSNRSRRIIYSQPADSLYRPLMFRSDNFFAEQVLLMVSQLKFGIMNDDSIINQLLDGDLAGLPQKPNWVDGSGLSRYNLFTPRDIVWILDKMKNEFGIKRMERLLPTGGTGSLKNYYKQDSGYIFAKTGSLSDVIALSGYLITKKNRLLIFSILINNYQGKGADVRRGIERFLQGIRDRD